MKLTNECQCLQINTYENDRVPKYHAKNQSMIIPRLYTRPTLRVNRSFLNQICERHGLQEKLDQFA